MLKVQKNFLLVEFLPPSIYGRLGDRGKYLVKDGVYDLAQFYRDTIGLPIKVNDWHVGGDLKERGYREYGSATGSPISYHKVGMAFDCSWDFGRYPMERLLDILKQRERFMRRQYGLGRVIVYPWGIHSDLRKDSALRIIKS